jgi:phage/plasmid-associated DNA primase
VFANVAYDLTTRKPYEIKKEDYITMSCKYEYIEPPKEDIEKIDKLFDSIFDKDEKRSYISILRSGLSGLRVEKFHIANGVGRNGKGVINELMMACVGSYGYKAPVSILTDKIVGGANPEVANLNHMRFVVVNEPNDNQRLLSGNMKRLTGDDIINARNLYESATNTYLDLTLVGEFNKIPSFMGEQDNASIKRLNITEFKYRFTENKEEIISNKYCKELDKELKTHQFKMKYKHALFKYLLDAPDEYYISRKSKELVDEYLKNSNELFIFMDDKYDFTGEKYDYLSIKNIWIDFKESDTYSNMTKLQKRTFNYKKLREKIRNDNELGKYYRDRIYINEEHKNSVLLCWKEK